MQPFAIGFSDDAQRAKEKYAGVQFSFEAPPFLLPMKSQMLHIRIGRIVAALMA